MPPTHHTSLETSVSETANDLPKKARLVLAAARRTFLQHGFSTATTDMIQRAAGVSKSTVYSHFANKEALFVAVVDEQCERLLRRMHDIEIIPGPISDILMELARAYLDVVLSEEGLALYRVVVAEAVRFPELARRFYLAGPAQMNNIVARVLTRASKNRELDFEFAGIDAVSSLLVNMIRGEAQMQCVTHPASTPSKVQRDQWASLAVGTFIGAFTPRAQTD